MEADDLATSQLLKSWLKLSNVSYYFSILLEYKDLKEKFCKSKYLLRIVPLVRWIQPIKPQCCIDFLSTSDDIVQQFLCDICFFTSKLDASLQRVNFFCPLP